MNKYPSLLLLIIAFILLFMPDLYAKEYRFYGGPSGGTFLFYAGAISSIAKKVGYKFIVKSSNGAVENIHNIDSGKADFALSYSGAIFHSRMGTLANDHKEYRNVMALGYLYGAPFQLVVRDDSKINIINDLKGKKVGIGNVGSGAALNAEIFFKNAGLWKQIDIQFIGYRRASYALKHGQIDAFLVLQGIPGVSIQDLSENTNIKLLDIWKYANSNKLFEKYPYYTRVSIPAYTYIGQKEVIDTYQEQTIWITNTSVPSDIVYRLLKNVYSAEGIRFLKSIHSSANSICLAEGLKGITTPLHPGAIIFWKEVGVLK